MITGNSYRCVHVPAVERPAAGLEGKVDMLQGRDQKAGVDRRM